MSDTHAQTAKAIADLERADAQGGKPHYPPGHVESDRPVRRVGSRITGSVLGIGLAGLALVVLLVVLAG